jgi:hypothetical protein
LHHSLLLWLFLLNLLLLHLFAQVGKLHRRLPREIAMALGHDGRLLFDFTGTPLTPIEWCKGITLDGHRNRVRSNMKNLFSNVSAELSEELFETLLNNANVRIERIVSYGESSTADRPRSRTGLPKPVPERIGDRRIDQGDGTVSMGARTARSPKLGDPTYFGLANTPP